MATEIKVPTLGESVTEATVAKWFKSEGDVVAVDEPILELETDKVTLEVNATAAGTIRAWCALCSVRESGTSRSAPEDANVELCPAGHACKMAKMS